MNLECGARISADAYGTGILRKAVLKLLFLRLSEPVQHAAFIGNFNPVFLFDVFGKQ